MMQSPTSAVYSPAESDTEGSISLVSGDDTNCQGPQEQVQVTQKFESLGRLAGGIAHDFNNLLTVINGYADLALHLAEKDSKTAAAIEGIRSAGAKAALLTQELLAFSRGQRVQPPLLLLNLAVKGFLPIVHRLVGDDVEVATVFDPAPGRVTIDPGQLNQVLMNLAVNARDAMPNGGRLKIDTANVEVRNACGDERQRLEPGSYVLLEVSDTGEGMDEDTLSRIFEPFFTTKRQGRGTGLGMSTVYDIVHRNGGCVWIHSQRGVGTIARIYLPRAESQGAIPEIPRQSPEGLPSEARDVPMSPVAPGILVVDDEAEVRGFIREVLSKAGYQIVDAGNSRQAKAALSSQHVDLMILDLVMPEQEGIEIIGELRRTHPKLKIIAISGALGGQLLNAAARSGAWATLAKPVRPDVLLTKVLSSLQGRIH